MSAKDIELRPIAAREANALVRRLHYSGKVVANSQVHIGVFREGWLEGALQFGPSLDKRRMMGLVADTRWDGFLELNRLAFSDALPRNSESRALAVALRILRRHAPMVEWVVTFADATQCGDGTIYRAAGAVLTAIKPNGNLWRMPDGSVEMRLNFDIGASGTRPSARHGKTTNESAGTWLKRIGATRLEGFQLRYVFFLNPAARARLTVPEIPYSEIERRGAGMYRGLPRAGSIAADALADQAGEGGSTPTPALT